jgi:hypothetical protein
MLMGGLVGGIAALFVGAAIVSFLEGKRQQRLRAAVAAEHAHYNSEERAARFGPLRAPLSWTVVRVPLPGTYRRAPPDMTSIIQIDVGGGVSGAG